MDAALRYRHVAELHASNIDQGFLSSLGIPFLALMYQAIDEGKDSVLLTEELEGRVVGFVTGAAGMGTVYRQMLRRPLALAWALLPSLIRPVRVKRIVDILHYGKLAGDAAMLPEAELLSIAVDPAARGGGLAEGLYRRLETHFRQCGVSAFRITVGDALAPAHRFYLRMGAQPVARTQVHEGEGSVVYVQGLA